jgi:hypothetical protein
MLRAHLDYNIAFIGNKAQAVRIGRYLKTDETVFQPKHNIGPSDAGDI